MNSASQEVDLEYTWIADTPPAPTLEQLREQCERTNAAWLAARDAQIAELTADNAALREKVKSLRALLAKGE